MSNILTKLKTGEPIMKRLSIFLLLLLWGISSATAQKRFDELNYPELNEFNKPNVETFTLDNGIQFYLVEDRELPLIDLRVMVRAGGVLVPDDKTGLASMAGTVIRSGGTEKYPADSLNEMLENRAASMETGIGFGQGSASMSVLKDDFEELLPVFIDLIKNPAFPQDKIELAKTQTKSGISRRNDNAQAIAGREFERLIYGKDSVYGRLTEYETVNNITREDLVNFHQEHFTGTNMMVGVVGDFSTPDMKKMLQQAFASLPAGEETALDYPDVDYEYESSINFIDKRDINQSVVYLGHIGGLRENPDYPKIQVMNRVLSGGFSGRLFQVVRTDLGLAYSVFGRYGMNVHYPGQFYAGVMTKTSTTAEAIDAIIDEIKRLQNEPITQDELRETKDQFLNSLVFRYTSYESVLYEQMSNEYNGMSKDAFDKFVEGVRATTVEDVRNVAQKYLRPDQLQILVVGNGGEIGDQLSRYGEVNEIDISIPQPGQAKEQMTGGDAAKGRALLDKMASALIENGTNLNSITISGQTTQFNPMNPAQKQTVDTKTTIVFPNSLRVEMQTPQGTQTIVYNDGQAKMMMMGQERQLPASFAQQFQSELNRDYLAIARSAGDIQAEYTGTEEVEGQELEQLRITTPGDNTITYLLNPDTGLPEILRYSQFNPQQGQSQQVEVHFSDWNKKGGINYAFVQVSYVGGNKRAENTVNSIEINPE